MTQVHDPVSRGPRRAPLSAALACSALLLLGGCATITGWFEEDLPHPVTASDPVAAVAQVESVLLAERTVRIEFAITAEGAVSADLRGELLLAPGNLARIDAAGSFDGAAADLQLVSDGVQLVARAGERTSTGDTPAGLREGLVIGLTRMGLLHNLALLSGGRPPDATDGTVRTWLQLSAYERGLPQGRGGRSVLPVSFDLTVGGEPSARATLYLGAQSGLPSERSQVVRFPQGEMRVTERYARVELDAILPGNAFVIDG